MRLDASVVVGTGVNRWLIAPSEVSRLAARLVPWVENRIIHRAKEEDSSLTLVLKS